MEEAKIETSQIIESEPEINPMKATAEKLQQENEQA